MSDVGNTMRELVSAYKQVMEDDEWAQFSNFIVCYPKSKGTMYNDMKTTKGLWLTEKRGAKVYVQPVPNWDDMAEEYDTPDFNPLEGVVMALRRAVSVVDVMDSTHHTLTLLSYTKGEVMKGVVSDIQDRLSQAEALLHSCQSIIADMLKEGESDEGQ